MVTAKTGPIGGFFRAKSFCVLLCTGRIYGIHTYTREFKKNGGRDLQNLRGAQGESLPHVVRDRRCSCAGGRQAQSRGGIHKRTGGAGKSASARALSIAANVHRLNPATTTPRAQVQRESGGSFEAEQNGLVEMAKA